MLIAAAVFIAGFALLKLAIDGRTSSDASARSELRALSDKMLRGTFEVNFEAVANGNRDLDSSLTFYRSAAHGSRWDAPKTTEDDRQHLGNIFLLHGQALPGEKPMILSCNSLDETCATATGDEVLEAVPLFVLFIYNEQIIATYEQPSTVAVADSPLIAGEPSHCFTIAARPLRKDEALPEDIGVTPGDGLPAKLCYASDGVPLRWQQTSKGVVSGLEAVSVSRNVDSHSFDPPYTIVPCPMC